MESVKIEAALRNELGKNKVKKIRAQGLIPGIIYGKEIDQPIPVTLDPRDLLKAYKKDHGKNILINLHVKQEKNVREEQVISQELTIDPLTHQLLHVDFYKVNPSEPVTVTVPVHLIGTAPGVKMGGMLVQKRDTLNVKCLPKDIPSRIEVNLSNLTVGQSVKISDLSVSEKITILNKPSEIIVRVEVPRGRASEDQEATAETAAATPAA